MEEEYQIPTKDGSVSTAKQSTPGLPVIHGQKSYDTYRDTFEIYHAIKTYFNKPYVDDPDCKARIKCSNCGETHTVYRPNHGLLHGLRQGLLAREIVDVLTLNATPTSAIHDIKNPFAVQVLASFQRSGRRSERTKDNEADRNNFLASISDRKLSLNQKESFSANELSLNLLPETDSIIARIIRAAHHLDLQRIIPFSETIIKEDVCHHLFDSKIPTPKQKQIIDYLWNYSYNLLVLSGDKYMKSGSHEAKTYYSGKFAYNSRHSKDFIYEASKL
jgi:hypothetical protein